MKTKSRWWNGKEYEKMRQCFINGLLTDEEYQEYLTEYSRLSSKKHKRV